MSQVYARYKIQLGRSLSFRFKKTPSTLQIEGTFLNFEEMEEHVRVKYPGWWIVDYQYTLVPVLELGE